MDSLNRKIKLMEEDLEKIEDRYEDTNEKLKTSEALREELQRENKQLTNEITDLESTFVSGCIWWAGVI